MSRPQHDLQEEGADPAREDEPVPGFQFGLGQVLLLLTATAVYFGLTRFWFQDNRQPIWFDVSAGTVGFFWALLLLARTLARVQTWRRSSRQTSARRAELARLVEAKRSEIKSLKANRAEEELDNSPPTGGDSSQTL